MDLLKEIKEYADKDTRNPEQQIGYLKQLVLVMMMTRNRLYKEHVIGFCGTLIKLYTNLNKNEETSNG